MGENPERIFFVLFSLPQKCFFPPLSKYRSRWLTFVEWKEAQKKQSKDMKPHIKEINSFAESFMNAFRKYLWALLTKAKLKSSGEFNQHSKREEKTRIDVEEREKQKEKSPTPARRHECSYFGSPPNTIMLHKNRFLIRIFLFFFLGENNFIFFGTRALDIVEERSSTRVATGNAFYYGN